MKRVARCAALSRFGVTEEETAEGPHLKDANLIYPDEDFDDVHRMSRRGRCIVVDHPVIKQFEAHAELLDISGSVAAIDDAIVQLAIWMDGLELSEDDETLLCRVGAILFREGLRCRMGS